MSRPYEGRAWRQQRMRIIQRDGRTCQLQLDGCTGSMRLEIHHPHGWVEGATYNDEDLITACHNCNHKIGRPTADPAPNPPRTNW